MATEFEHPRSRTVHLTRDAGSMGVLVTLIAVLAIGALVFFTFFDRTPSGPSTATSPSVTKTAPPATTAPAQAPSTK